MIFDKGDGLISFRDFFKVRKRFNFSVILGLLILEFNLPIFFF
jgi:hypothetical protein